MIPFHVLRKNSSITWPYMMFLVMTTKITIFRVEAVSSFETLVNFYQTTGHHIHEDCNLQFLLFHSPAKAKPPVLIPPQ
jgi:hypothetical protein